MKLLVTITLILISISLCSQDTWDEVTIYENGPNEFTTYEIGLKYSSSSIEGGVGILARYKLNSSTFIRAALEGIGRKELTKINNDYNFGAGIRIGIEKRKWSGTDLYWNYGIHVGLGLSWYEDKPDNYSSQAFSSGLLGGINYIINKQFMVGFEILPIFIISRYGPSDNLPNSIKSVVSNIVFLPSVNLLYRL